MKKDLKSTANKPKLVHVLEFTDTVKQVADVLEYGAHKYAPRNYFIANVESEKYLNAALRHIMEVVKALRQENELEKVKCLTDFDSKLPHLAHAIASLMIASECSELASTPPEKQTGTLPNETTPTHKIPVPAQHRP